MKFVPASTAACSARRDSSSSTAPQEPPIAQAPKLIAETPSPVRPSGRYCIGYLPAIETSSISKRIVALGGMGPWPVLP